MLNLSRLALCRALPVSFSMDPAIRTLATEATHKSNVIFSLGSSKELNDTLTEILHKIVLPNRLPADQQKYIFNSKYQSRLQTDPIIMEVDGYEHRFEPILLNEKAKSKKLFLEAIRLMRTREDWENLSRLLSGYEKSSRKVSLRDRLQVIRSAGSAGNIWAVINCLRNSEKSTLCIKYLPHFDEILNALLRKALHSELSEKETKQAAQWATIVMDLVERPEHRRTTSKNDTSRPLHRQPQALAQYLLLLSMYSVHHNHFQDPDGLIKKTAHILIHEWPAGQTLREINPVPQGTKHSTYSEKLKVDYQDDCYLHWNVRRRVELSASAIKAVELAKQVVPELAKGLDDIVKGAVKEIEETKKNFGLSPSFVKGMQSYEKLLGENQIKPKIIEVEVKKPVAGNETVDVDAKKPAAKETETKA